MRTLGAPELIVILAVVIVPFWKIFAKAGFSAWLSLTLIVPLVNIIMLFYLAFAEWPVYRELRRLKQSAGSAAP